MNFNETGFRSFYHHLCALELNEKLSKKLKNCPGIEEASHAVVYGFINPEKGLMLELMGCGRQEAEGFSFHDIYEGRRITIGISDVAGIPFQSFEEQEPDILGQFSPRLAKLRKYAVSAEVEKSRKFVFLDECREKANPDIVRVYLSGKGLEPEEHRVRITGLGNHVLTGSLLEEPEQDFGVGEGGEVRFAIRRLKNGRVICVAHTDRQEASGQKEAGPEDVTRTVTPDAEEETITPERVTPEAEAETGTLKRVTPEAEAETVTPDAEAETITPEAGEETGTEPETETEPEPAAQAEAQEFLTEGDLAGTESGAETDSPAAPAAAPRKITGKRELWESRLLDLSLRNMLLNLPRKSSVIPVMSSYVNEMEDALSDGHEFHLLPAAEWITSLTCEEAAAGSEGGKAEEAGESAAEKETSADAAEKSDPAGREGAEGSKGAKGRQVSWLASRLKERGVYEITSWPVSADLDINEKLRQEFRSHRLYTYSAPGQLEKELTTLYRAARSSQQENGVSSLYLGIGLVRWYAEPQSTTPCYAPMILLPVEMVRKSANQGYALHLRDEEAHFNTTLLELLRQNYDMEIGGLEPLPSDEHGIDTGRTFSIVREALGSLKKWGVVESCVIGNFSFAQFAIWNDIHTSGQMLDNSKIVRSLMKGYVDWDIQEGNVQKGNVQKGHVQEGNVQEGNVQEGNTKQTGQPEEQVSDREVYLPINVDASQLEAIKMAAEGSTFVLHGPPGTGKSQTITGIIANLMAKGRTVLFVAEKMAALSVVQKRLSSLGIGAFCLELHSDKANKKHLLSQLEKALETRNQSGETQYGEYVEGAAETRADLDKYRRHLHAVHNCGRSLRELVDLYETVRDEKEMVAFDGQEAGKMTRALIQSHLPLLSRLTAAGEDMDKTAVKLLSGVRLSSFSAEVRGALRENSGRYLEALGSVRDAGAAAARILQTDIPDRRSDYVKLYALTGLFYELKAEKPDLYEKIKENRAELQNYYGRLHSLEAEEESLLEIWSPSFLREDMDGYLARHESAGRKLFFGRGAAMAAVVAQLQPFARIDLTFEAIPGLLGKVSAYQDDRRQLEGLLSVLSEGAAQVAGRYPSLAEFKEACREAENYRTRAASFPGGEDALSALERGIEEDEAFTAYRESCLNLAEAERAFNELLARQTGQEGRTGQAGKADQAGRSGHEGRKDRTGQAGQASQAEDDPGWVGREAELCRYLIERPAALKDLGLYNQIRQQCVDAGLAPAVEAYEGGLSPDMLLPAYKKGLYYALINEIISTDDVLSCFSGVTFNEAIQQFKRLDEELIHQTRNEILNILSSRVPTSWDSPEIGKELNLLRKAIGSNARGMSIRMLFERVPRVLKLLCPCMLMSPNSVARYLAQDNGLFDVVIFDEASQLPTCKAAGALARAENAVIVGDPKQMPPTSFFAGSGPSVEDLALDDLDSILDDTLALGIPSRYLRWHYRSRHESLIAFSNREFYDNKMYTFPSANDLEHHVTSVHVDGLYSGNTNVKEAEAVVAEIVRRSMDPQFRDQSVGVVAFNIKQQALIENLLSRQFQADAALDAWANEREDPLFVKNLENVQGDERDVILFSIGFGPDEKGHISMNFGPINKSGGGKRLNVAFSRARITMTVYSSIRSSDIQVTETSPEGLIAFRDFLKYAEQNGNPGQAEGKEEANEKAVRSDGGNTGGWDGRNEDVRNEDGRNVGGRNVGGRENVSAWRSEGEIGIEIDGKTDSGTDGETDSDTEGEIEGGEAIRTGELTENGAEDLMENEFAEGNEVLAGIESLTVIGDLTENKYLTENKSLTENKPLTENMSEDSTENGMEEPAGSRTAAADKNASEGTAESGSDGAAAVSAGITDSICREIEKQGYRCETMIGRSDFHVDIGVVDPFEPERYMMGILLDGEVYRQTENTRDREVAQMDVLTGLGWTLHRVWTIDWWDNREKELKRLSAVLERLRSECEAAHKKKLEIQKEQAARQAQIEKHAAELKTELESLAVQVLEEEE